MKKMNNGQLAFRRWVKEQNTSVFAVSTEIGDRGGQLAKWASNSRKTLPLHLILKISQLTTLPFNALADRRQIKVAQEIFFILERDAAEKAA